MRQKLLSILALLCITASSAWAWSGSGTQADPYLITSASDWNQLVSSTTYFGSGKYYQLETDISVTSPVSRDASLQGTFDGNGHTITLTYSTSTKYDGLFPSIENLTVKNLHVAGTITTSNECAAGIAGKALGTNYFKNCRVSITISSSLSGNGYHGGLVAAVQGSGSANHVYIDNCSFDGGLTGTNTSYWCGFIGWSDYLNHVSISNSYFRPRNLNVNTDDFHPFSHVKQTYTNCLYTFYYSNQTPGDYSSEEGISNSASLTATGVKNTLGSDNWKSVTESSVVYVVPIWQYTIFFDANGGSGAPAAQTKKDGTDLTLSSDVPTREGYNFFKWNTKADGTGINYAAGETYTVNTGVTLYAQWTAIASYNVTANSASEAYWATFYSNAGNYQAPEGTQVFTVKLEGTGITMNEVSDRIAKSGQGVVLKKTTTGNFTMTLTETAPAGDFSDNSLTGTMTSITNPGNAYVLGGTNGAGFYKLKDTGTIGANKAYLTYSAAARGFFLFDETTGIEMPTAEDGNADAVVFDLQGRRVLNPTKGLYIVNGKKVFINK